MIIQHPTISLSVMGIGIAFGKLLEDVARQAPTLAAISYIVAIIAGCVSIYFTIKRGKK